MTNPNQPRRSLGDIHMRDPFLLTLPDNTYRLYGTTDPNPWVGPGTGFDAYRSDDLENWDGPHSVFKADPQFSGSTQFWAPEVHPWNDAWYMFATFADSAGHRGTHVLRAGTPDGPFQPISQSPITPPDWMCLDGTLFVDDTGTPWLVFCREWLEVTVGQIWAVALTDDLRERIGDPVLLFRANEAPWTVPLSLTESNGLSDGAYVTDGPFLYRTPEALIMLWSSRSRTGYAVGVARATGGLMSGPWEHDIAPIWDLDGGHAMIGRMPEGGELLVLHAPNNSPFERPQLLPLTFARGTFAVSQSRPFQVGRKTPTFSHNLTTAVDPANDIL